MTLAGLPGSNYGEQIKRAFYNNTQQVQFGLYRPTDLIKSSIIRNTHDYGHLSYVISCYLETAFCWYRNISQ